MGALEFSIFPALLDAIKDTLVIIPFLLLIFYVIEFVEFFYSSKIAACEFSNNASKRFGPLLGVILASIPQCGLSVIASTLYIKRFVSKGTLIAVYLATSDEAIPVMLSNPDGAKNVFILIGIKVLVGLVAGYLTDFISDFKGKNTASAPREENVLKLEGLDKGCHSHSITKGSKAEKYKELFLHPVVHTLSVTFFVFLVTLLINVVFACFSLNDFGQIQAVPYKGLIEIVLTAVFGIIPNCAVSVGITIMYLKGIITFASCVSGLCAGAGLGILVLIRKNKNKKDTFNIILLLLLISILAGLLTAMFS